VSSRVEDPCIVVVAFGAEDLLVVVAFEVQDLHEVVVDTEDCKIYA
jgi:hypothetical protein